MMKFRQSLLSCLVLATACADGVDVEMIQAELEDRAVQHRLAAAHATSSAALLDETDAYVHDVDALLAQLASAPSVDNVRVALDVHQTRLAGMSSVIAMQAECESHYAAVIVLMHGMGDHEMSDEDPMGGDPMGGGMGDPMGGGMGDPMGGGGMGDPMGGGGMGDPMGSGGMGGLSP